MTLCLYDYINFGDDKQLITIDSINNRKIYLLYKTGEQSLYIIMYWLINVFKYKCGQFEYMNDFRFSQNGEMLETTFDLEVTKNLINSNSVLKLNIVNNNPSINYGQFMLDDYKFESNNESIMMYIKTLTGKQIIVNVNPKITKVGELKLKMQDMEGIPPEQQRFVFDGIHLEDDNLLSYYNVQNESCFHLVLRLRGCMYNELYGINGNYEPLTNIMYDISEYEIWDF